MLLLNNTYNQSKSMKSNSKLRSRATRWLGICGLVLGSITVAQAATYYVDASRADDTGAGASWGTAKKTIQAAVDVSVANDTVLVSNGVYSAGTTVTPGYSLSNRVAITNNILVKSVNGPAATIIRSSSAASSATSPSAFARGSPARYG